MAPRHELALSATHPPDINHVPICLSLILAVIEHLCNMAMAVVTEQVVHPASVHFVSLYEILVPPFSVDALKLYVLVSLSKRKVIHSNSIRSSEIMNQTFCVSYSCMTD